MATRARRTGKLDERGRTTRKFDGKTYLWRDLAKTKREIQEVARHLRKQGYSARITKTKSGNYEVWAR